MPRIRANLQTTWFYSDKYLNTDDKCNELLIITFWWKLLNKSKN